MSTEYADEMRNKLIMEDWLEARESLQSMLDPMNEVARRDMELMNDAIADGVEKVFSDPIRQDLIIELFDEYATVEQLDREVPPYLGLIGRARQKGWIE